MLLKNFLFTAALGMTAVSLTAQKAPDNWFNLDKAKDGVQGVSTEEAYRTLLKGKKGQTVIVAVLDSGVDFNHEDLKDVMWVNPGEIPGNGIDDDKNGYIDDIHGWSFIGGKKGNIDKDSYEIAREYKRLSTKYQGKTAATASDKKEFAYFQKIKTDFEGRRQEMMDNKKFVEGRFDEWGTAFSRVKGALKGQAMTEENIKGLDVSGDTKLAEAVKAVQAAAGRGVTMDNFEEQKKGATEYFDNSLNYGLNPDFDPRAIVGDNPNDVKEKYYGSTDCIGPDASHGTHVAGIIAASRGNGIGMDGVADNVRIMSVRCVPDGDERDKDVANAIIYAVDNGASIINMSFGKGYSPDKGVVDAAVKYAMANDVLLVHAAGNDSENNDTDPNFPNDGFQKRGLFKPKTANNWLEIGALDWKGGEKSPARFSNYGKKNVDFFSPGVAIYSTVPGNEYASFQGTSMAAPCAAGVAAVLRSHYPGLSAAQVKDILIKSAIPLNTKTYKPGTTDLIDFSELSVSGGVVNTVTAVKTAQMTKGASSKGKWRKAKVVDNKPKP